MKTRTRTVFNTRTLVTLSLLSAVAFIVMLFLRIPVVAFLKYDPKDIVIAIAGLLYGPLPAMLVTVVVALLEMVTVSDTGLIGLVMNILASYAFVLPPAILYKRRQSFSSAVVGLVAGAAMMTGVMLLWNYFITPFYLHVPRADVAAMLVPVFLPFNLLKSGINAALVVLLYKPLVMALRRTGLVPSRPQAGAPQKRLNIGVILVALLVLASCVMGVLVFQGII